MERTTTSLLIALSLLTVGLLATATPASATIPDLGWCETRENDEDDDAWHRNQQCYLWEGDGETCVYREKSEGDTPDGDPYHEEERSGCIQNVPATVTKTVNPEVCYPDRLYEFFQERPETPVKADVGACINKTTVAESTSSSGPLTVCIDNRPNSPNSDALQSHVCVLWVEGGDDAGTGTTHTIPDTDDKGVWCSMESSSQGGEYDKSEECLVKLDGGSACLGWERQEGKEDGEKYAEEDAIACVWHAGGLS